MKRTFCKEKGRMIDFSEILHYDTFIHKKCFGENEWDDI